MKRFIGLALPLFVCLWSACGSDDNPSGPDPTPAVRVVATTPSSAPSLTNVDDAAWNGISWTAVAISPLNSPKVAVAKPATLPDSVQIQAITFSDSLYLRLRWSDPSHDIWRDRYIVDSIAAGIARFSHDCCEDNAVNREDQLFVMFAGLAGSGYDVWNWRSLTTGPGFLAEGKTYLGGVLASDSIETSIGPAISHSPQTPGSTYPTYMHPDSTDFNGYLLYNVPAPPHVLVGLGWTPGQIIPGWLIDSTIYGRSAAIRGSRWDIRAAGGYDSANTRYTVMMCRPMNTGYTDDLDLSTLDSVSVKGGVLDNKIDVLVGDATRRGFTEEFWLIF